RGWRLLAYSAREGNSWDDFLFNVQLSLRGAYSEEYDRKRPLCDTPEHHARVLLDLLRRQHEGRLLLFFDNLESVQNPADCSLTDANVHAWIEECRRLGGPLLLLTSRWKLPDWQNWLKGAHHPLSKPGYGDFLRYVQHLGMGGEHVRLRRLYEALGGNFKGLQLVAAAQRQLSAKEEEAFIRVLETAQDDLQTYMAIEKVTGFLAGDEYELLKRLPAYAGPVPLEGIVKLTLDLPKNRRRAALQRLLDFSLADT
ncbi:MAG: hypothetical protein GY862_28140, partial [Gammaproteobacteria bacterium]|nr:hypothetical protein [Gammaproteobacteria bacterium]